MFRVRAICDLCFWECSIVTNGADQALLVSLGTGRSVKGDPTTWKGASHAGGRTPSPVLESQWAQQKAEMLPLSVRVLVRKLKVLNQSESLNKSGTAKYSHNLSN
jgi:hypothetical protein